MTIKNVILAGFSALLISFGANTQAQDKYDSVSAQPSEVRGVSATVRDQLNRQGALIKSRDELSEYREIAEPSRDPLSALSASGRREFLNSLQFGPSGLASFQTDVLERELRPVQSYAILELFGVQEAIGGLRHAREVTELDKKLNEAATQGFWCDTSSMGGGNCDDDPYVEGRCISTATCGEDPFPGQCHPPSCP